MNKCSYCGEDILDGSRKTIHPNCSKLKYARSENGKKIYKEYELKNRKHLNLKKKEYKENNKEFIHHINREWKKVNRGKVKDAKKRYFKNNKEKYKEYSNKSRKRNPKKAVIRNKARIYVKLNNCCDICGSKDNLQRHHWDYNKSLFINTLCMDCHRVQHTKNFENSIFGRIEC